MTKFTVKKSGCICLSLLLLLGFVANAADVKTHAMSMRVYKKVTEAQELMDNEQTEDAIALIKKMQEGRLSKYERAQSWYLLGSWYYRLEQEELALDSFTKVLDGKGKIPEFLELNVLKTLSQLHMVREEYSKARDYCLAMLELSKVPGEMDYALLGQIYYKMENWQQALEAVLFARELVKNTQKAPSENLLVLQNAIYFEMKNSVKMIATLEDLIRYYPKTTYLLYLASVYGEQENNEQQTVIMESLYENGHLMLSSEVTTLASLYMSVNVPYKAAKLLEKAIADERIKANVRNYEQLSQAWRLAADMPNAINALHQAARLSDSGAYDLQMAYLQYHSTQWQQASHSVAVALDKGIEDTGQRGDAWLLKGMSLFNMMKFEDAIIACQQAAEFDNTKALARQWISYINSEQDKFASLQLSSRQNLP